MGICITCGAGFSGSEREVLNYFKNLYHKKGVVRWVYVNDGVVTVSRNYIKNNGDYFRIDEWEPK
jgi:hypothetical protein